MLRGLRVALDVAGYDEAALRRVAAVAGAIPRALQPAVLRIALAEEDMALATLIRLFRLGDVLPRDDVREALPGVDLDELAAHGLLVADGDGWRAPVRLDLLGDVLVVCDRGAAVRDTVMGVALSTRLLASVTPRAPVANALDLGTGSGVHALAAARHAERVVGTDVNPKALRYAELGARLNGVANVEWRGGSFFDPVAGERFGLAVANPPFAISPRSEFRFRDAGMRGDELSRTVTAGMAQVLADGGYGCVVCNWAPEPGERWWGPPARWLADSGCDALMLRIAVDTPLSYAAAWNVPHHAADPGAYAAAVREWVEHLEALGIESIVLGALVLRRRDASANRRVAATAWGPDARPAGEHVLRVFAAGDRLGDDPDLAATAVRPAAGVRVERVSSGGPDGGRSDGGRVEMRDGLAFSRSVDASTAELLLEGADRPAAELEWPIAEVRALMKLGLLDWRALG